MTWKERRRTSFQNSKSRFLNVTNCDVQWRRCIWNQRRVIVFYTFKSSCLNESSFGNGNLLSFGDDFVQRFSSCWPIMLMSVLQRNHSKIHRVNHVKTSFPFFFLNKNLTNFYCTYLFKFSPLAKKRILLFIISFTYIFCAEKRRTKPLNCYRNIYFHLNYLFHLNLLDLVFKNVYYCTCTWPKMGKCLLFRATRFDRILFTARLDLNTSENLISIRNYSEFLIF